MRLIALGLLLASSVAAGAGCGGAVVSDGGSSGQQVPIPLDGGKADATTGFADASDDVGEDAATAMDGPPSATDGPSLAAYCASLDGSSCYDVLFCVKSEQGDGATAGVWIFLDESYLVDFFKALAVQSGVCASVEACGYDPLEPPPADAGLPGLTSANYSNALRELVGPDGNDYAWAYIPSRNEYLLVRKDLDPTQYGLVVELNQCILGPTDDAGTN
jgi:hypothetical protein